MERSVHNCKYFPCKGKASSICQNQICLNPDLVKQKLSVTGTCYFNNLSLGLRAQIS